MTRIIQLPLAAAAILASSLSASQGALQPAEPFGANARWSLDLSSRRVESLTGPGWSSQQVVGFDLHKVFQGDRGDIGTLVFQPYLVRLGNVQNAPFFFDQPDDWQLTWRIANFNYTGLAGGRLNFRVGHFEVPFGLEQNIDTNGTLRQYTFSDRGIKADWGVSINGTTDHFEYEVASMRGSGNDLTDEHHPSLFAARVGTLSHRNLIAGLSWFDGEILGATGTVERERVGLDVAWYRGQWEMLFELSDGKDEQTVDHSTALAEVSWRNGLDALHLYAQLRRDIEASVAATSGTTVLAVGTNFMYRRHFDLGAQVERSVDAPAQQPRGSALKMQFRYRL